MENEIKELAKANGVSGAFACVDGSYIQDGLSKREYFAIQILASTTEYVNRVERAVSLADRLLEQLEATKK